MRELLKPFNGQRITVQGIFDRFVEYRSCKTALFQGIERHGDVICNHAYVQHAEGMLAFDMLSGERVQFSALVHQYRKGKLWPYEYDYGLTHPTAVKTLDRQVRLPSLVSEYEEEVLPTTEVGMSRS